jgi:hypothetical protein
VANRAGGNQEWERLGDVSAVSDRSELVLTLEGEAEQGAKAALGGRSAAAAETEKDRSIRQLERTLGRKSLEIEILKYVVGE